MKLEMTRVQILGLKPDLMAVLQTLQKQGCLHIDNLNEIPELSAPSLTIEPEILRKKEELTFLLAQVEGLLDALGISISNAESLGNYEHYLNEIQAAIADLSPQVHAIIESHEKLVAEKDSLPRFATILQKLLPILPDSAIMPGNVSIGLLVSRQQPQVLEMISKRISIITSGEAEIASIDVDEISRAMLVVTPDKFAVEIEDLLGEEDISRLRLPPDFMASSPDVALASIQHRLIILPEEIQTNQEQLQNLNNEWREKLTLWRNTLQDALDLYNVLSYVGETEHAFIIAGWVPAKYFKKLQDALESDVQAKAFLTEFSISQEAKKSTPVALSNPSPIKPFESLVRLLSIPLYEGIDPSGLMAFFMPLFFGMMLGDIGYGSLLLVITLVMLIRIKRGFLREITKVLVMGSIWAILFGFLFGECFGTLGAQIGIYPIWFPRESSENLIFLIALSIGVGVIHITLGLILGVWEALREKSRNHLLERGGMLFGLASLFLLLGVLTNFLPKLLMIPSVIGLIIGILLLGAPLGLPGLLIGPIEFISLIGNILSYMRIAAIGLASVYLAKVANDVAGAFGSLVVGLILAVVIHCLNLLMGAFSPTIHSLRLHFVEFFHKFYEGGGHPYDPFRSRFISRAQDLFV